MQGSKLKRARRVEPKPFNKRDPLTRSQERTPAAKARSAGLPCSACGLEHNDRWGKVGCNGHIKNSDPLEPCTNAPVNGATVCVGHGGNLPQVKAAADRRVLYATVEGQTAELMREMDLPDQHPIDGLLEVVRHTGSMMRLLGSLCAGLDLHPVAELAIVGDGAKIGGETGVVRWSSNDALTGFTHLGDGVPHVLVQLYGVWADRYARSCKLALDANIDERLVRNAEATSSALFKAVEAALEVTKLTPDQAAIFAKALGENLRKLVDPMGIGVAS